LKAAEVRDSKPLFLRTDHGLELAGGTSALRFGRAPIVAAPRVAGVLRDRIDGFDWTPDLGAAIGSRDWWRGLATCTALCGTVWLLSPGLNRPIYHAVSAPLDGTALDEARSLSFGSSALGATSGMRLAATARVRPLADTPERPILEATATLGSGVASALQRTGVGAIEAGRVAALVAGRVDPAELAPGTRLDITLGRRATTSDPRPLERLAFRARFDLALEVVRAGGVLQLNARPIAIDHTPLRIRGRVGASLYRAARAAGAPASAVEAYIKSVSGLVPMGQVGQDDRFDLILEQARAATGETQVGKLLYAGLEGRRDVRLVRWQDGNRTEWLDPKGIGERKGAMTWPVAARISSNFGWRVHPVLGFRRLHKGMDFAAAYGTPIRATTDGTVAIAGRHGGYGNFVKLSHGGGLATGYGHMSRIVVRPGMRVAQGQVIGYVGSTGLSTGPHLHYELWRNGAAVDPRSVSFATVQRLGGDELVRFRQQVARLMAVASH
jgi:murein DD-endopeptidase MepM/ murein hydrolase activator NlpD